MSILSPARSGKSLAVWRRLPAAVLYGFYALTLLSNGKLAVQLLRRWPDAGLSDTATAIQGLESFREVLPGVGDLSYFSPQTDSGTALNEEELAMVRYALLPTRVVTDHESTFILGRFASATEAAHRFPETRYLLIRAHASGLYLFRRRQ